MIAGQLGLGPGDVDLEGRVLDPRRDLVERIDQRLVVLVLPGQPLVGAEPRVGRLVDQRPPPGLAGPHGVAQRLGQTVGLQAVFACIDRARDIQPERKRLPTRGLRRCGPNQ